LPDQDLVEELAAPHWWVDRKGEVPPGKLDYYQHRIVQYHKGYLSSPYTATYYELAQRHPEVCSLSEPPLHSIAVGSCEGKLAAVQQS
jgi:hypothetical protein